MYGTDPSPHLLDVDEVTAEARLRQWPSSALVEAPAINVRLPNRHVDVLDRHRSLNKPRRCVSMLRWYRRVGRLGWKELPFQEGVDSARLVGEVDHQLSDRAADVAECPLA
jgi:hypothetical protein